MKQRHIASARLNACAVLEMCGINRDSDFHTLSTSQVESLLREADRVKYRKPKNANGSRARYFFQLMQRHATAKGV